MFAKQPYRFARHSFSIISRRCRRRTNDSLCRKLHDYGFTRPCFLIQFNSSASFSISFLASRAFLMKYSEGERDLFANSLIKICLPKYKHVVNWKKIIFRPLRLVADSLKAEWDLHSRGEVVETRWRGAQNENLLNLMPNKLRVLALRLLLASRR